MIRFCCSGRNTTVWGVSQGRSKMNQEQKNKTSETKNFSWRKIYHRDTETSTKHPYRF